MIHTKLQAHMTSSVTSRAVAGAGHVSQSRVHGQHRAKLLARLLAPVVSCEVDSASRILQSPDYINKNPSLHQVFHK
jgi:hypothetical protein